MPGSWHPTLRLGCQLLALVLSLLLLLLLLLLSYPEPHEYGRARPKATQKCGRWHGGGLGPSVRQLAVPATAVRLCTPSPPPPPSPARPVPPLPYCAFHHRRQDCPQAAVVTPHPLSPAHACSFSPRTADGTAHEQFFSDSAVKQLYKDRVK